MAAENWEDSKQFGEKLFALPTEMVERILIQIHRIDKFELKTLEFFKNTKVETLFLSHIRAFDDAWLRALESYKSLTYLDISNAYRINDE